MSKNILRLTVPFAMIAIIGLLFSCGSEKPSVDTTAPQNFLPELSAKTNLKRISDVRTFIGQNLWEYIDGGAEMYYLYDFEIVATTDYKDGDVELVVDIYKFANPDKAFGLYSVLRPADAQLVRLGVEGFLDPAVITFVKGDYVVKVVGYDETDQSGLALTNLAEELAQVVPGKTTVPETFGLFPSENAAETSRRFLTESFMGRKFLTDVYSQGYIIDGDTLALFLSDDPNGDKFAQWKEIAEKTSNIEPAGDGFGFDEDYSFVTTDKFSGKFLIGLKNGRLVGAVNYSDRHADFVKNWLAGI